MTLERIDKESYSGDFALLNGKTIVDIQGLPGDGNPDDGKQDCLTFVCADGSAFRVYHQQDCCEHVSLGSIRGDISKITGFRVVDSFAYEDTVYIPSDIDYKPGHGDSFTVTVHTIITTEGVIQFVWLGVSNGYYSESIYFTRTHEPVTLTWNSARNNPLTK